VQIIDLDLKSAEAQVRELEFRLRVAPREDRRLVKALEIALNHKRDRLERLARSAHRLPPVA
jgi:hypothetical protein